MSVTIVVGGQFGSEGKGKVAFALAREEHARVAVRVGGPNSGHTVIDPEGAPLILRQLPTAALLDGVMSVLPPGAYVSPEILLSEVEELALDPTRVAIDPNATVISDADLSQERRENLRDRVGSTQSGTGAALVRRTRRLSTVCLAREDGRLSPFLRETSPLLRRHLERGDRILVEGTQGFGLSLLHSPHFPYATSRDTTAAGFLSEAGLSPLDVDDVVMVIRAFPIRVSGNSGPLPEEIKWEDVTHGSGSTDQIIEYSSVTKTLRRVARFDPEIVRRAINVLNPSRIVLNHVDYVDTRCRDSSELTGRARSFVERVQGLIGRSIDLIGTGPATMVPFASPDARKPVRPALSSPRR